VISGVIAETIKKNDLLELNRKLNVAIQILLLYRTFNKMLPQQILLKRRKPKVHPKVVERQ
jgi:hypothetical protein